MCTYIGHNPHQAPTIGGNSRYFHRGYHGVSINHQEEQEKSSQVPNMTHICLGLQLVSCLKPNTCTPFFYFSPHKDFEKVFKIFVGRKKNKHLELSMLLFFLPTKILKKVLKSLWAETKKKMEFRDVLDNIPTTNRCWKKVPGGEKGNARCGTPHCPPR